MEHFIGEIKERYTTITIAGYKIETQYLTVDRLLSFLSINISGQEPTQTIEKLTEEIEELQEYGGGDNVEKILEEKYGDESYLDKEIKF